MKNSKTRLAIISIFVLIGILMQSCGSAQPASEVVKLKAIVLPYTSFGPFFIAQEEGLFSEQNLEVEFVNFDSGTSPLPLLEQGEVDILGSGPSLGLFNAIGSGSQIRVVADKGYLASDGCTYMALLGSNSWMEKNQTTTTDSFKGVNISIDPTNFEAFMFEKVLKETGLELGDVNPQDIAPPALGEAVQNDAVDLISIGDPWIVRLTSGGNASIWKPYQEVVPNMQFGFVLFGPSLFRDNPEAGARFLAAYLKGVKQYNEGKTDRNLEILAKYTKLDTDTLQKACWPPMNDSGEINLQTVNEFQAWAADKDLIDKVIPDDQYWDGSFVNKALGLIK